MSYLTKDEEAIFEAYIVLTFSRKVLQNDLVIIEGSPLKIKEPYLHLVHHTLSVISKDLFEVKKQMQRKNMKIDFGENDGVFSTFTCYVRGYTQTSRYLNSHLRNKVRTTINRFFLPDHKTLQPSS